MNKKHMMISFDSESWKHIKDMLGLGKNLKCVYCGVRIMKNNVGGVSHPKGVFCKNTVCLVQHVMDQDRKHDTNHATDDGGSK